MRPCSCIIFVQLFWHALDIYWDTCTFYLFTEAKNWYTIKFCLQCLCTLSLVRCFTTTCKQTRASPPNSDHLVTAGSVLWVCKFTNIDLETQKSIIYYMFVSLYRCFRSWVCLDNNSIVSLYQIRKWKMGEKGGITCLRFYDYIDDFDHPGEAFCLNVFGVILLIKS